MANVYSVGNQNDRILEDEINIADGWERPISHNSIDEPGLLHCSRRKIHTVIAN